MHTHTHWLCVSVSLCVCVKLRIAQERKVRELVEDSLVVEGFTSWPGNFHMLWARPKKKKKKKRMLVDAGFPLFLTSFILVFCQNLNKRKESLERSCNGYLPLLALPLIFFLLSRQFRGSRISKCSSPPVILLSSSLSLGLLLPSPSIFLLLGKNWLWRKGAINGMCRWQAKE